MKSPHSHAVKKWEDLETHSYLSGRKTFLIIIREHGKFEGTIYFSFRYNLMYIYTIKFSTIVADRGYYHLHEHLLHLKRANQPPKYEENSIINVLRMIMHAKTKCNTLPVNVSRPWKSGYTGLAWWPVAIATLRHLNLLCFPVAVMTPLSSSLTSSAVISHSSPKFEITS